jgi:hypothetical protein
MYFYLVRGCLEGRFRSKAAPHGGQESARSGQSGHQILRPLKVKLVDLRLVKSEQDVSSNIQLNAKLTSREKGQFPTPPPFRNQTSTESKVGYENARTRSPDARSDCGYRRLHGLFLVAGVCDAEHGGF